MEGKNQREETKDGERKAKEREGRKVVDQPQDKRLAVAENHVGLGLY